MALRRLVAAGVLFLATLGVAAISDCQARENVAVKRAESLISKFRDPQQSVRNQAMESLSLMGDSAIVPLKNTVKDSDPGVRACAVFVLGKIGSADALSALLFFADDPNVDVR